MKTLLLSSILSLGLTYISLAQDTKVLRSLPQNSFKKGEKLTFSVNYGFVHAGEAVIEVLNEEKKIGNRDVYHIVGTGRSKNTFDFFFKVRDRYETYLDKDAIVPWLFLRHIEEGSYKLSQSVLFNHYTDVAKSGNEEIKTPNNIQDLVSTYYFARCTDFSNAKINEIHTLQAFLDDEIFTFSYKFLGRETITTNLGTFKCLKFCPTLLKGRVFKHEDDMTLWVTDDENKLPIRAEAKIIVGSVKMDLSKYEGVANPIAKVK
ncbi:MAG: DUF3108 domain-containing protein [Bacteroidia bacterium]|nr:DUF3108 domain-containing protein [Bacteroidia bacterium]